MYRSFTLGDYCVFLSDFSSASSVEVASSGRAGKMVSFTTLSPSLITRLQDICQTPQLTLPAGANGNDSQYSKGPNHPTGSQKTALRR